MALFSILISPLNAFPWVINGLMEAWVSTKRIQAFLKLSELDWDQYYSDMRDTLTAFPPTDEDRSSTSSTPGCESPRNQVPERMDKLRETTSSSNVAGHALGQKDSRGLGFVSDRDRAPVAKKKVVVDLDQEDEEIDTASQSSLVTGGGGGEKGYTYAAYEERPSIGRHRRRRDKVIVVRNGEFSWSRKNNGERASDRNDDGTQAGESGAEEREGKEEEKPLTKNKTAESAEVSSPVVEWKLSDLNFTILSVSNILTLLYWELPYCIVIVHC